MEKNPIKDNIEAFVQVKGNELIEIIQNKLDKNEAKEKSSKEISVDVVPHLNVINDEDIDLRYIGRYLASRLSNSNYSVSSINVSHIVKNYANGELSEPTRFVAYHIILERKKQKTK